MNAPKEGQTATGKILADAIERTIARSSDRVKAACQTTTPNGADVDVLTVFDDCISKLEYHYRDTRAGAEMTQARTAVAALLSRNAELEAERDAWKRQAKRAETFASSLSSGDKALFDERNALAGENEALREKNAHLAAFIGPSAMPRLLESLAAGLPAGGADQPIARTPAKDNAS